MLEITTKMQQIAYYGFDYIAMVRSLIRAHPDLTFLLLNNEVKFRIDLMDNQHDTPHVDLILDELDYDYTQLI